MRKIRGLFVCLFLIVTLILPVSLSALDFGLITSHYAGYDNQTDSEGGFEYRGDMLPRLTGLIGDFGEFILSAGLSFRVKDELYYVLELLRTEINMRFGGSSIKAGRIYYSDPLGFIANGLFDGIQFSHNSSAGIFNIGAWYTGFLYKETANITMTDNDRDIYEAAVNYGDFLNSYFAPSRLLASFDWEHPSIAELFSLKAAVTGQVDFSGADEKLHTQYFTVKASFPAKSFLFEIGGSLQAAQTVWADDYKFTMAFAGDFGIFWTLPSSFHSRLSLSGRFSGGRIDDFMTAFIPVTNEIYSEIFQPKLSALSILGLNYTARLNHTIGTSLSASCFVRGDLGTFTGYPAAEDSEGYFLGTEFYARLVWSPFSDLQFNIGGGAFLPALGDAGPEEKILWRAEITMVLALF